MQQQREIPFGEEQRHVSPCKNECARLSSWSAKVDQSSLPRASVRFKLTEGPTGFPSPICSTTVAEERVRWAASTIRTVTPSPPSLGGRRTIHAHGTRANTRRRKRVVRRRCTFFIRVRIEDGGLGVHKQERGKAELHPPFTEDCLRGGGPDAMVA